MVRITISGSPTRFSRPQNVCKILIAGSLIAAPPLVGVVSLVKVIALLTPRTLRNPTHKRKHPVLVLLLSD
jgi:hypothetical protein